MDEYPRFVYPTERGFFVLRKNNERNKNCCPEKRLLREFAIPFRTNLKHKFAFYFYTSKRKVEEQKGLPGIDYTKAVVIQESDIERNSAVDKKEWLELKRI